jgi:hypothetical protein
MFLGLILLGWGPHAAHGAALTVVHDLHVRLVPAEHKLIGADRMAVTANGQELLLFYLSRRADRIQVTVNDQPRKFSFQDGRLTFDLPAHEQNGKFRVSIGYECVFDDPIPIQPVNTDNPGYGVTGSITAQGSFLLAGAGWYPELSGGRASYTLEVAAPAGMIAVTAGRSLGQTTENNTTYSRWEITEPVEGLALSVAPYVVAQKAAGKVTAMTFFLPQSSHLATAYLNATAGYLALYEDLFGPYPFSKFAVVENLFPTGYGFPSYTLLGTSVLQLPFIVQTSLGHEIAHCWWGNGVYVDYSQGNWSEGLTTYVADYLYKEMKSPEEALEYRRQLLRNYATIVKPGEDFALSEFLSRSNPLTKTIGYDKAAMVFHMLRRIVGEENFWGALRDVYRDRLFKPTTWRDFQAAFERRSKQSLQPFFGQFVFSKGAPQFSLHNVTSQRSGERWKISGSIVQTAASYEFGLSLVLETQGKALNETVHISGSSTAFEFITDAAPVRLETDPNVDVFRRLEPQEIPPSVNSLKSAGAVLVVTADSADSDRAQIARTLVASLGIENFDLKTESQVDDRQLRENDLLLVGLPARAQLFAKIPAQLQLKRQAFVVNGTLYDRPSDALFSVIPHPSGDGRVLGLFWALSPSFAESVARKITHYGKYSYLTFRNGINQDRGFWPATDSPLEFRWQTK